MPQHTSIRPVDALGSQWRIIEQPWPTDASPVCAVLQLRRGTEWTAMAGFQPNGADMRSCGAIYNRSTSQSISSATFTTVDFTDRETDTDNAVTTGAGWLFTCPTGKAGFYHVVVTVGYTVAFTAANFFSTVRKNGLEINRGSRNSSNNASCVPASDVSAYVELADGDTMDVQTYQDSGVARTIGGSATVRVSIFRVPFT